MLDKLGHKLELTYILTCLLDHAYGTSLANIKMERQRRPKKLFTMSRAGTQYVAMVTKLLISYCRAHLVESYCKESNNSDTKWLGFFFFHSDEILYYVNSRRNVDSEKSESQMGFEPTTLHDLVGCSTTKLLGTLW